MTWNGAQRPEAEGPDLINNISCSEPRCFVLVSRQTEFCTLPSTLLPSPEVIIFCWFVVFDALSSPLPSGLCNPKAQRRAGGHKEQIQGLSCPLASEQSSVLYILKVCSAVTLWSGGTGGGLSLHLPDTATTAVHLDLLQPRSRILLLLREEAGSRS